MLLRSRLSSTGARRSIASALALDANPDVEVNEIRRGQIAEIAAAWPMVLFALILAPGVLAFVSSADGNSATVAAAAIRGSLIGGFALVMLAQFHLPALRDWPTQVHVRVISLCVAGLGVGLMSLLPLATGIMSGQDRPPPSLPSSPRWQSPRSPSIRCGPRRWPFRA